LGSNVPALHDYGEMVCGTCMDKHTFLWQYRKEIPDEDSKMKIEVCNGTAEHVENTNEMKSEDIKNKTIKAEERGKFIFCILLVLCEEQNS
jgi:hypothetical protein